MKTTLELVHDLQRLLSGPEKWTQIAPARDARGYSEPISSPLACCWCFFGAVEKVTDGNIGLLWGLARRAAPGDSPISYNDAPDRTFADIKALMAKMEELAKDQP